MKVKYVIAIVVIVAIGLAIVVSQNVGIKPAQTNVNQANNNQPAINEPLLVNEAPSPEVVFVAPLSRAQDRITKKPFGIKITPTDSPVQPEKFSGYHTGTDFETFPEEADVLVPINAVCAGKVVYKQRVNGYGGVLIQSCDYQDQPITVLYGHIALSSINLKVGDELKAGEHIGNLGQGYSYDTDGERKHLHLGIHRGSVIELKGYVQNQADLSQWIDWRNIIKTPL